MSEGSMELPVAWVGNEDVPIHFANQFLVQVQPGEFIVSVGQIAPPAVIGTPEEQKEELERWPFVSVHTVCRFGLTPKRVEELIDVLQRMKETYDEGMAGGAS